MHNEKTRKQAVTKYVIYGNVRRVAEETGVNPETIYDWMKEDWWKTFEAQVRSGVRTELQSKMQGIVDKAIDIIHDRLDHGDMVLNMKTGDVVRRPVPARDVQKIMTEVLGKKINMEKEVVRDQVRKETVTEMLGALQKGFIEFNRNLKKKEETLVIDNVSDVEFKEIQG